MSDEIKSKYFILDDFGISIETKEPMTLIELKSKLLDCDSPDKFKNIVGTLRKVNDV